jgi:RNA polymerase sigma factor (sigma-70 family)
MAALEQLPFEARQVIELRNFDRLPYSEIAARVGRTEQATRQSWVQAVRQLRQQLGEEE